MTAATTNVRMAVLQLAQDLDPAVLSAEQALHVVEDLAVADKALTTVLVFSAVRVAKTELWRGKGHATAADWLAAQLGVSVREASGLLSLGKRAEKRPKTKAAMKKGKVSPTQADAITDAAESDPDAEDELLDSAENDTTARLKEKAAAAKAAATDERDKRARARRSRSRWGRTNPDGTFDFHLHGPAADLARLEALVRPWDEQAFRTARPNPDGTRDSFANRSYDAFMAFALHQAGHTTNPNPNPEPGTGTTGTGTGTTGNGGHAGPTGTGGSAGSGGAAGKPRGTAKASTAGEAATSGKAKGSGGAAAANDGSTRHNGGGDGGDGRSDDGMTGGGASSAPAPVPLPGSRLPGGSNVKVIIRIDWEALMRGHTVAGETCDIPGLGPLPVSAVRELMADAFLAAIVTKGRDVHTVAHLGRGLNAHQRTAIEWTGTICSNIACNRTVAVQMDHNLPWAQDQQTKLDNIDPLCPHHHQLKTHHGWHLEPGTGRRRFLPPDDHTDHRGSNGPFDGSTSGSTDGSTAGSADGIHRGRSTSSTTATDPAAGPPDPDTWDPPHHVPTEWEQPTLC